MKVVVEELSKRFSGNVQAVDHVNLDIPDGEFAVFLGPSGCGKTTTLRMIAGLERPDSGRIFIGDQVVNNIPPKHRRVAMVFQNFALYPSMTVYDNIAFPLEVRKFPKQEIEQRVHEAARLVGVETLLGRRPKQVSGGEAQRVSLARALVRQPDVFLMDEPLSNLDAKLRVQLRTEIKRLHQETKTTTIYVTHDQEEAMTLGDKIVIMSQGKVQQIGAPYEVFFRPNNVFVAGFVGSPSMNLIDGNIRRDEELIIELPGFTQPVPERFIPKLSTNGNGRQVKWGIRPEHIRLSDDSGTNDVPGQIEVIEPLGSRQLLFVRAGAYVFSVLEDATIPHSVGEHCHLCFDEKYIHVFDSKTGLSLAD